MNEFVQALFRISAAATQLIASRINTEVIQPVKRAVKRIRRCIMRALWWMFLWWPLIMAVVILLPTSGRVHDVTVLVGVLSAVVPFFFVLSVPDLFLILAGIEILPEVRRPINNTHYEHFRVAVDSFVDLVEKAIAAVRIIIGCQLLFGLFLMHAYIKDDPILALELIVVLCAMLCFLGIRDKVARHLLVIASLLAMVLLIGGRHKVRENIRSGFDYSKKLLISTTDREESVTVTRSRKPKEEVKVVIKEKQLTPSVIATTPVVVINPEPQKEREVVIAPRQLIPPAVIVAPLVPSVPAGYSENHCRAKDGNETVDYSQRRDLSRLELNLSDGCFWGPFKVPQPRYWRSYTVEKDTTSEDWATVWCEGHSRPSRVHVASEDFDDNDFKGCYSFYLQGHGSLLLVKQ